ncbi:MAG: TM2 domain-containing protein [Flavipsychrobacter sp.]|nr:TM2 domain-containing protein [Flavipsychrobacter sp.]
MEQSKIDMFIATTGSKFPAEKMGIINSQLEKINDSKFLSIQSAEYKNPTVILIISLFFGSFGVDRFMLGQTGMGVGKLLTCGGLGVWTIIDWFLIMNATKEKNFLTFTQIAN